MRPHYQYYVHISHTEFHPNRKTNLESNYRTFAPIGRLPRWRIGERSPHMVGTGEIKHPGWTIQWYCHVKRMPEERITKLIMDWIPRERRKRGRPRKNVDGRSTSSHDKKFKTRSMEKQRGMEFGFRKTATAVKKKKKKERQLQNRILGPE